MRSLIYSTAARPLLPLMLVLSVIALFRGHNEPGGGFVGGLLAASAFAIYALAIGVEDARKILRVSPLTLIGTGLVTATLSGLLGPAMGDPYLHGVWTSLPAPGFDEPIKVGTPVAFDIGVYLVVLGGVLLMVLNLEETNDDAPAVH